MIRILPKSLKHSVSCFFLLVLTTPTWGFDLTRHSTPVPALSTQVIPKDAIPAIDTPEVVPASAVDDLAPEEQIIGVVIGEEARAYPIRILQGHEIINDEIGGRSIAVTW